MIYDDRILACGLLRVMGSPRRERLVEGRHVLVSMGRDGILWAGQRSVLGKDLGVIIVDDDIACKHIPAEALVTDHWSTGNESFSTNGAGDVFFGSFVSSLLRSPRGGNLTEGTRMSTAIREGLQAAKSHIMKSLSDKKSVN